MLEGQSSADEFLRVDEVDLRAQADDIGMFQLYGIPLAIRNEYLVGFHVRPSG